jgi:hypothetical protein
LLAAFCFYGAATIASSFPFVQNYDCKFPAACARLQAGTTALHAQFERFCVYQNRINARRHRNRIGFQTLPIDRPYRPFARVGSTLRFFPPISSCNSTMAPSALDLTGGFVTAGVRVNSLWREAGMPMKKYKPEQIVTLLRQVEVELANGKSTPQACKEAEITSQTNYR